MAAPYTPTELRAMLPLRTDDLCVALSKMAAFDLANLRMMQWIFDECGNVNPEGLRLDICSNGCVNYCGDFGTVVPNVNTGAISWFMDGAIFAAGNYRINYVSGGLSYTGLLVAFSVQDPYTAGNGFKIVYSGAEVDSPGDDTTFPTVLECEAHNSGDYVDIVHTGGKIGIYMKDSPIQDNRGNVTFSMECAPTTTTTSTSTTTTTTAP